MRHQIDFLPIGDNHGDAICVRYRVTNDRYLTEIIDGGYTDVGTSIIEHLDTYYGTRAVDNVILTHADDDHARGLITVLETCPVGALRMNRPWLYVDYVLPYFHRNYTRQGLIDRMREQHPCLVELENIATRRRIPILETFQGMAYGPFTCLAPSRERYISLIPFMDKTPEPYGVTPANPFGILQRAAQAIADYAEERWDFETLQEHPTETGASNESSIVQMFSSDGFRALFTGDVGPQGLLEAYTYATMAGIPTAPNLMQVPHQGSRRNVTPTVLDAWLGPRLQDTSFRRGHAYCTVGVNKAEHPRKKVTNAFRRRGYPVTINRGRTCCFADPMRAGWSIIEPLPFFDLVEQS